MDETQAPISEVVTRPLASLGPSGTGQLTDQPICYGREARLYECISLVSNTRSVIVK